MPQPIPPGLLQVTLREGNKCTADLVCGLCDGTTDVVFYEGAAEHRLDGALLWMRDYSKCPNVNASEPIGLRIMWLDERGVENWELDPGTRELRRRT